MRDAAFQSKVLKKYPLCARCLPMTHESKIASVVHRFKMVRSMKSLALLAQSSHTISMPHLKLICPSHIFEVAQTDVKTIKSKKTIRLKDGLGADRWSDERGIGAS